MTAFACLIFLVGCSEQTDDSVQSATPWDTSFNVDKIHFPDSAIAARSDLSSGNTQRLWKFFKKLDRGENVNVGFIGGSISGGAFSNSAATRYTSRTCTFLNKMFSQAQVNEYNAAIGATNSRFGVSRVAEDLLHNDPDLVVIEFTVNDDRNDWTDTVDIMANYEGLIRQCLADPDRAVVLLFLYGKLINPQILPLHEQVGRYYDLPMIDWRNALEPEVTGGAIAYDSLFADVVHPNDQGHLTISYLLYSFLKKIVFETSPDPVIPVAEPLISSLYDNATMYHAGDGLYTVTIRNGWNDSLKEFGRVGLISYDSGAVITFTTQVRELTLGYRYWNDHHSQISVDVDGVLRDTIDNYFADDWGDGYLRLLKIYTDMAGGQHTIKLTHLDNDEFLIEYQLCAP